MSNAPNDSFGNPNDGAGYGQAPPKKSKTWLWVLGIIGGLGLVAVLVCCGGAYFMSGKISEIAGTAIVQQLDGNPVMVEHVGSIESAALNLQETAEYAQENPGQSGMVLDVVGSKSNAQLVIQQQGEAITSAELIMPDGTTHDVPIDADTFDVDMGEDANMTEDAGSFDIQFDAPTENP